MRPSSDSASTTVMEDAVTRKGNFHDTLSSLLSPPQRQHGKAKLRHRLECKGKPRPFRNDPEFETDRSHDFLDDNNTELPKAHPKSDKGGVELSNFKSKAVYCEVRLAELLGKAGPRVRPITPGKCEDAPDSYRTSVCCLLFHGPPVSAQLLEEMSGMDTPYSRVLRTILEVLKQSIYSNYVAPHTGGTFDQVPYFELVSKLESQHQRMLEEQEQWKDTVHGHQVTANGIQLHIEELNDLILKEKAKVSELQKDLLGTQRSLGKATKQVTELTHKLNQSRNLVLQASDIKIKYEAEVSKYENLHARYMELTKEVQHLQSNLSVARQEAADGVPKSEFGEVENMVFDLQSQLQKAENFVHQAQTMTPRPNWPELRGGPFFGMPTSKQAAEICELNKNLSEKNIQLEAECAAFQVALVEAKLPIKFPEGEKKKKLKGGGKKKKK